MNRRFLPKRSPRARLSLQRIAVVLPAREPDERLLNLAQALVAAGFTELVVVDDGSGPAAAPVFAALMALPEVTLHRHGRNLGKGCALKTGFQFVVAERPLIGGVVTADVDGQHTPRDIVRVARRLLRSPERVVLGVRTLGAGAPWRSRVGNQLTCGLFALLSGRMLRDTQTGLRGFGRVWLPELLHLPGERYEYEMVALAALCRRRAPLTQVAIATVYFAGNRGSHFRPVRDSLRVYGALWRFYSRWLLHGTLVRESPRLRAA